MQKKLEAPGIVWFMRWAIALMFLVAVLVGYKRVSHPLQQGPGIEANKNTEDAIKADQKPHDIVNPLLMKTPASAPNSYASAQNNERKNEGEQFGKEGTEFWPPLFGYKLKVTDTLLAAFTGLLFITTWLLWRATDALVRDARKTSERQTREMKRSLTMARRSANAARDAVKTASDSLALSRFTTERQLRAYIGIVSCGIVYKFRNEVMNVFLVTITLRNCGQTPAYKLSTWIKVEILNKDAIPFGDALPFEERQGQSITVPGADIHINFNIGMSDAHLSSINDGSKNIFIWGGVDFIDAFDKSRFFVFRMINDHNLVTSPGEGFAIKPHKVGYSGN